MRLDHSPPNGISGAMIELEIDQHFSAPPQKVFDALVTALQEGYKGKTLVEHLAASLFRLLGSFALVRGSPFDSVRPSRTSRT